jgi:pimeloyl-ACP methyl ester carboxylesterase
VRAIVPVAIPHLALIKPSPKLLWNARHFIGLGLPSRRWLARHDDFAYLDTLIGRWAPQWSGDDRDATLREVKAAFADERVLDGALAYYRDRTVKGIGELAQPALIVGGTSDISPPELFRASTDHFTGPAEALILDGAGHWPHRERADAFHAGLLGFLGGLDRHV